MKKYTIITLFLLLLAALTTCKKEPDAPTGGNKIEIGQTTTDYVAYKTARVSTQITSTGGNEITQYGHCWSTQSKPTIDDAKTTFGKLDSAKTFTSELTGLQNTTTYFVRSYVVYPYGTVYGSEKSIKTIETRIPHVTTAEVTDITKFSATSGGSNDDGGLIVTNRGVCWNTTGNPTLENSLDYITESSNTGSFISNITGLTENTTYYLTAFSTNEKGTGYGTVKSFKTTELSLPTVETKQPFNITENTATCGGNVTNNGNGTVTTHGVCWNTTSNPTLENSLGYTTNGSSTGNFLSSIVGLEEKTNYYVAAYATNEKGTAYGQVFVFVTQVFICGQHIVVYGGQTYHTVQIGNQCWMQENLNFGIRINGSEDMQNNKIIEKYCYDDNEDNCDIYGGLYQWNEMMQYTTSEGEKGICPDGWHIPTNDEWKILEGTVDSQFDVGDPEWDKTGFRGYDVGNSLKSTYGWVDDGNGLNNSGFTAFPSGYRRNNGYFDNWGKTGLWWSSTEYSSSGSIDRWLYGNFDGMYLNGSEKVYGFSVRCIKD